MLLKFEIMASESKISKVVPDEPDYVESCILLMSTPTNLNVLFEALKNYFTNIKPYPEIFEWIKLVQITVNDNRLSYRTEVINHFKEQIPLCARDA